MSYVSSPTGERGVHTPLAGAVYHTAYQSPDNRHIGSLLCADSITWSTVHVSSIQHTPGRRSTGTQSPQYQYDPASCLTVPSTACSVQNRRGGVQTWCFSMMRAGLEVGVEASGAGGSQGRRVGWECAGRRAFLRHDDP